jgi:hypothetical protein
MYIRIQLFIIVFGKVCFGDFNEGIDAFICHKISLTLKRTEVDLAHELNNVRMIEVCWLLVGLDSALCWEGSPLNEGVELGFVGEGSGFVRLDTRAAEKRSHYGNEII